MGALSNEQLSFPAVHQPRSLQEAWELKRSLGASAVYVSGGTLLRTQWEAGTAPVPRQIIDLRNIDGMRDCTYTKEYMTIGSLVSLSQCRKDRQLSDSAPAVSEAARCIAAPAVRNLATLGGNMASGYGDILPALLVYGAEVAVFDGSYLTVQSADTWLSSRWTGAFPAEHIIAGIRLPLTDEERPAVSDSRLEVFRKVGRREAFTASLVTVAIKARIDNITRCLYGVRIAAGGGSGRPMRLAAAEAVLEGALYEERLLAALYEAVESEFETSSDPFATADYKRKTAGNLIVSEVWKAMNTSGV